MVGQEAGRVAGPDPAWDERAVEIEARPVGIGSVAPDAKGQVVEGGAARFGDPFERIGGLKGFGRGAGARVSPIRATFRR